MNIERIKPSSATVRDVGRGVLLALVVLFGFGLWHETQSAEDNARTSVCAQLPTTCGR